MNPLVFVAVDLIALYLLVQAIYRSSRRLVSFGYAVLGFGLVIGLGFGAMFNREAEGRYSDPSTTRSCKPGKRAKTRPRNDRTHRPNEWHEAWSRY